MTIKLPLLNFNEGDLEPHLSKHEVHIHYNSHTRKYFDVVNELVKGTIYEGLELHQLINKDTMAKMDSKLFLNACQASNHSFYWQCLTPTDTKPSEELQKAILEEFESPTALRSLFIEKATNQFGSGWTWLIYNKGRLQIKSLPNAGTPLTTDGQVPLLTCDVWEHAYLYDDKYAADRKSYVEGFWKLVNWDFVSENFEAAQGK